MALFLVVIASTFFSFSFDRRFQLVDAYRLNAKKTTERVAYFWSHKAGLIVKNPRSLLAAVGAWRTEIDLLPNQEAAVSVPVLVYHGLPSEGVGHVPHRVFVEQMEALREAGWQTITLNQFRQFVRGETRLPDRSFLLTFDDGRKDTFYPADPVLQDLGFNAVMFAISKKSALRDETLDSTYYISPYELVQMEKSGRWEIESHGRDSHDWYTLDEAGTVGHFFSNRLWLPERGDIETEAEFKDRIVYDLSVAKLDLEKALGKKITTFAFPFGDFGQDTVNYPEAARVIKEAVPRFYEMAFYQAWSGVPEKFNYPNPDLFMMRRIEPLFDWSGADLLDKLEMGRAKPLPYESGDFDESWVAGWGSVARGESLDLKAASNTAGAASALSGSWHWQNYTFTADVDWQAGSNVVLLGHRTDEKDYYGCNFTKTRVSIKRATPNGSINLVSQNYAVPLFGNQFNLGMRVGERTVSCLVEGQVVLEETGFRWPKLNGGIGVEVWDSRVGVAAASFDNVSVIANPI